MKARVDKTLGRTEKGVDDTPDPGTEDVLAGKIMKFCTESGFPHLCFRKSQKAKKFLKPGVTD
jgi:hypothetical protein